MAFDLTLFGTVLGGAATALLTRFLGITQRMQSLERRLDAQGELVANLHSENVELRAKVGAQDKVILGQGRLIGDLTRQNREQAGQIAELRSENTEQAAQLARKDADNAALAMEMARLRHDISGSRDKPSGLPLELYGAEPPADVRLPRPPKVP